MKAFLKTMAVIGVAAASGTVMAQSQSASVTAHQIASIKQRFEATESSWQRESESFVGHRADRQRRAST